MELFVDTNTLATESTWIQKEFGIDIPKIIELFAQTITLISQQLLLKLKKYWLSSGNFLILRLRFRFLKWRSMFWLYFHYYKILTISPSQACTFYWNTGRYSKTCWKNYHFRFAATSSCMGIGSSVFCQRNQLKNYFRGVFGQNISIYLRKSEWKSCRVTDFCKIVRCRNSRVGRLYESKQICISFQNNSAYRHWNTGGQKTGKYIR